MADESSSILRGWAGPVNPLRQRPTLYSRGERDPGGLRREPSARALRSSTNHTFAYATSLLMVQVDDEPGESARNRDYET